MTRFHGDAFIRMAFLMVSMVFLGVLSFVPAQTSGVLRGAPHTGAAGGQKHTQSQEGDSMMPMLGFATAGGVAFGVLTRRQTSKTRRRYTTDQILPKMEWLSAGFGESDLEPGEIRTVTLAGLDVAVGKTEDGKVFAVGDKAPPTGISLSQGGYVEGNNVVEPQYGSKFDAFTGDVTEWCTFPPLLGAAIGAFMGGPTMIAVFNCRGGGNIQVEVDTNARKAYEADYWKGLLDAQGKNDGTYY
jgi:nitrite reductase/ring-hydroxylating ferredoxin subunit